MQSRENELKYDNISNIMLKINGRDVDLFLYILCTKKMKIKDNI